MLKRIQSAISTAHAISLAIREAPDAIREAVEFARENGSTTEEVEFWKAARDRWMGWACHVEGGQDTPGMPLTTDGDTHMMARITAALNVGNKAIFELESWRSWARDITAKTGKCHELRMSVDDFFDRMANNVNNTRSDLDLVEFIANEVWLWAKERITQLQVDVDSLGGALVAEHKIAMDYAAEITEARELLSGLLSWLGYGLGGDDELLPSMIERVKHGIERNFRVLTASRDAAKAEALKAREQLAETERELVRTNQLYDEQCKATIVTRLNTEGLYEGIARERDELKSRVENQASEIASLRARVTDLVDERDGAVARVACWAKWAQRCTNSAEQNEVKLRHAVNSEIRRIMLKSSDRLSDMSTMSLRLEETESSYRTASRERDDLKAKLARYEAAERCHQVTAGDGELPPSHIGPSSVDQDVPQ